MWASYLERETTLTDLFEAGKMAIAAAMVINAERGKAKLPPIKSGELFRRLEKLELEQTVKVNQPKFSDLIDKLIKIKSGPNGGVGMTELDPATNRNGMKNLVIKNLTSVFLIRGMNRKI